MASFYFPEDTHIPVPTTPDEPLSSLLQTLALERVGDGKYRGNSVIQLTGRVYGGQVLAQAVQVADDHVRRTLGIDEDERLTHSISGAFLRPGRLDAPIDFSVFDLHDGGSFSTRIVLAEQDDNMIFEGRVSLQKRQPGPSYQDEAPTVTAPENVPSSVDFFASLHNDVGNLFNSQNALDVRTVEGNVYVRPAKIQEPKQHVWFRIRTPMPEGSSNTLQRSMLAYAVDQFMLDPVLRGVGLSWMSRNVAIATLDHTIWFHRNFDLSNWILAEMESPSAQNGRGLTLAKFFQDGKLIATMAQEGMVRAPEKNSEAE